MRLPPRGGGAGKVAKPDGQYASRSRVNRSARGGMIHTSLPRHRYLMHSLSRTLEEIGGLLLLCE